MTGTGFSRTLLREGDDVNEGLVFLADIERTLTDPDRIATARNARGAKSSARLRGFDQEQVDEDSDRLIELLDARERLDDGHSVGEISGDVAAPALNTTVSGAASVTGSSDSTEFVKPQAVDQILRSMTQDKEQ